MNYLKQANESLRSKNYEAAIEQYVLALQQPSALPKVIQSSLKIAQSRYLKSRETGKPRVCIAAWSLSHNAAGRAATLAQLYESMATVQIIGCYFKKWGIQTWAPLRNFPISIHGIYVQDEAQFINQALELVLKNPCDLLHLSKPRFPNILIGLLYKLIWGSKVVVDIDDEELSFVSATEALALDAAHLPSPADLTGKDWTRIAVGLANAFDSVTVVNTALQKKYGGTIVRHARDESVFKPSIKRRQQSRTKLGIAPEHKVVLFLGTPRAHKGLLETAQAIDGLKRDDVLFLVVGEFTESLQAHQRKIEALLGNKARFLGDQPFETIPEILAAGDICLLLQDPDSMSAQFQTPAKLSDALAMGLTVLAESTPALADLAEAGAFQPITRDTLIPTLVRVLDQLPASPSSHPVFTEKLSLTANRPALQSLIEQTFPSPLSTPLQKLAKSNHFGGLLRSLLGEQKSALTLLPSIPNPHSLLLPPENAEPEAYIQLAGEAMSVDDWAGAYKCWKTLFERLGDELNTGMLLRITRELFKLDAFPDAAKALTQAAAKDPNNPSVLCEQAAQYYYHCYSSWLMLITENEPNWYEADGLETRPDWKTACQLIEKAETASPRNNLRRYVQAYLLLAEEAWDKQQRTEAHEALRIAISAIGPNKIDKLLSLAIFNAVDEIRNGKFDEKDPYFQTLQDQLKALPLELLSVPDWLCLNDILNWNGLLLCGFVAREKAVDLALAKGKANPNNKEILKTALKAALDLNDIAQANVFLAKIKYISPNALDVQELDACCELMKGNIAAFRQKWPHKPTLAEQRMRGYLKGKTVAVVGPATSAMKEGEEINKYDIVVRINWKEIIDFDNINYGDKVTISLYNAHSARKLLQSPGYLNINKLDFRLLRKPNHQYLSSDGWVKTPEYPALFYKSHNGIQSIIFTLAFSEVKCIKLFCTDFYINFKHHYKNYRTDGVDQNALPLRKYQPILSNHCLITQFKWTKILFDKSILRLSKSARVALDLNIINYLTWVESLTRKRVDECSTFIDPLTESHSKSALMSWLGSSKEELKKFDEKPEKYISDSKLSSMSLNDFKSYISGKNIALVANSSDLLKTNHGAEIDSNDIVIRFNSFFIDSKHTGEKLTIHAGIYLHNCNYDIKTPIRAIVSISLDRWIDSVKTKIIKHKQGSIIRFHHVESMRNYKELDIKAPPTTGFVMLLLLLKLGGFKKISIYGFTFYENGQESIFRNSNVAGLAVNEISDIHDYCYEKWFIINAATEYDKRNNIYKFYDRTSMHHG